MMLETSCARVKKQLASGLKEELGPRTGDMPVSPCMAKLGAGVAKGHPGILPCRPRR